ncbi:MAG: mechanosensitive ion channel family protein [Acidimicrobiia bacterium]|nr:mechanosensitive ion channel family protein [Acidimicrobiia bacterium]
MVTTLLLAQATLADACGPDPGNLCELIFDLTGNESLAQLSNWVQAPLAALLILAGAWIVNRIVRRLISRTIDNMLSRREAEQASEAAEAEAQARAERRPNLQQRALARALALKESSARSAQRTRTLGNVMLSLASIIIYTIAGLMALAEFDINLGPLIASAGIVGIALGFGAQSLVKDFLSGIFMLVEDQYGVGDVIDVGDAAGVVEAVNLRTTQLRDVHGTLWHVPNGEIRRVANKSQEWARTVLDVEVAYDTDIASAMAVIKRVADEVWEEAPENATILEEPEIWGVEAFGASAIAIRLAMKVEPAEQWATARLVRGRLKEALDAEGIEIPFPQRTVWMHQVEAGPTAESQPTGRAVAAHAHEQYLAEKPADEETGE